MLTSFFPGQLTKGRVTVQNASKLKLAILSDMHAFAGSYEAALSDARREGFDQLIILGDLLTYGVEPEKTVELTNDAIGRDDAILVMGNHDQMYLDLDNSDTGYYDQLSGWVKESIDWTVERLSPGHLAQFPWLKNWSTGHLFVAHANPYDFGDWTYLRTEQEMRYSCRILAQRGFRWGLFGHTHRAASYNGDGNSVYTVGSLGQPRDRNDPRLQWVMAEIDEDSIRVERRYVDCDTKAHMKAINATTMSKATKQRLCGFFK